MVGESESVRFHSQSILPFKALIGFITLLFVSIVQHLRPFLADIVMSEIISVNRNIAVIQCGFSCLQYEMIFTAVYSP